MKWTLKIMVLTALLVAMTTSAQADGGIAKNKSLAIALKDDVTSSFSSEAAWNSAGGATETRVGTTIKGAATAAEILRKALLEAGFKVVNVDQLRKIQREAAERYKLEDNIDGLKSLGKKYGVSQFIVGSVAVHRSGRNDFGLFTGTASLAVNAYTSGGKYLLSETVMAKEVGATDDEAGYKALVTASRQLVERIVGANAQSPYDDGLTLRARGVRAYREVMELQNAVAAVPGVKAVDVGSYSNGVAEMAIRGSLSSEDLARGLKAQLQNWRIYKATGGTVELEPQ